MGSEMGIRDWIHDGTLEAIRPLVPESTYRFFQTPEGEAVAAAIRGAAVVVHH